MWCSHTGVCQRGRTNALAVLLSCDRAVHPTVEGAMVCVCPGLESCLIGPTCLRAGRGRQWGRAGLPCHVVASGGRCPAERHLTCRYCVRCRTKESVPYCDVRLIAAATRRVAAAP